MNERADIECRLLDLDPGISGAAASASLCDEILHPDDEDEVMLRGGGRYVPRLTRGMPAVAPRDEVDETGFTLAFGEGEAQDRAVLHRIAIPRPGPEEVAGRVHAAGLNFRDAFQRIGLLPTPPFHHAFS